MKAKVSVSNDLTIAVTPHETVIPGVPPVFPEAPAPIYWPPGMLNGQNKLTYSVLHRGLPIAQDDHDLGAFIPHLRIPPDPAKDAMNTVNSSRKIVFGASTVKGQKLALGAGGVVGMPPMPMLCCAEPMGLPTGGDVTNFGNTVQMKITPGDIAAGLAHMVTDMLIDLVGSAVSKYRPIYGWAAKSLAKRVKNVAVNSYKAITTDEPVKLMVGSGIPGFPDLVSHEHGVTRDEEGVWKFEAGFHFFSHDVGFEAGFLQRPVGKHEQRRGGSETGDVVVERDGKKVTYHSDPELGPGNRHGAATIEESGE